MSEETQFTEQSLREALERLGSKSDKKSSHRPDQESESDNVRPFFSSALTLTTGHAGKKRRFINDGGVVVEHRKDIGRHNRKPGMSGKNAVERSDSGDRQEELIQLKKHLEREQQRGLAVESEVEGLREKVRSLETRLVHYQFQLDEREKKLTLLKEENVKLKLREGKKAVMVREVPVLKRKIKSSARPLSTGSKKDQEPVKWWSGD